MIDETYLATTDDVREVVAFIDQHDIGGGSENVEVYTDYSPFYVLPSVEQGYWVVELKNGEKLTVGRVKITINKYPVEFAVRLLNAMVKKRK